MSPSPIESSGAGRGSLRAYAVGFILSVFLTAAAFGLVMSGVFARPIVFFGILAAAVVQMLVHLHYFLHLDTSSAARWNVAALLFTVLILVLFVGGTLWIMHSLHYRMM